MPNTLSKNRPKSNPFGSSIKSRSYSAGSEFRFGFNTQEKDKEIYNNNETYTATFWEFDGRLGRRWNINPLFKHWESPYACFNNNPIIFADPNGLAGVPKQQTIQKGDTYWKLAKNSKGAYTVDDLKKWNKGVDPTKLKIGQKINVSDPTKTYQIGKQGKSGTGEDFQSGTAGVPTSAKGKSLVHSMNMASDNAILGYSRRIIKEGALLTENEEADKIIQHFAKNSGCDYSSANLSKLMAEQQEIQALGQYISNQFRAGMILHNGDYSKVIITVERRLPSFSFFESPTLKTFVGGTQQLDIWLTDLQTGPSGTYRATIHFNLFDDFGIDETDFTNPSLAATFAQNAMAGLWILQKLR